MGEVGELIADAMETLELKSAIVLHRRFKKRMEDPIMSRRFKLYLKELHDQESKDPQTSEAAKEENPLDGVRTLIVCFNLSEPQL
jgi:hypothetical protein